MDLDRELRERLDRPEVYRYAMTSHQTAVNWTVPSGI